jgi:PPOX class probable F420-dependent enzyme
MRSQRQQIRMTEAEICAFLASQRKISVATLNPDGSAHVMPMYYVTVEGRVAFWSYTKSQKIRNLQRDPRITVMAEAGEAYFDLRGVQIRGQAQVTADPAVVLQFGELLFERQFGSLTDESRSLAAVTARKRSRVVVEPLQIVSWDHSRL